MYTDSQRVHMVLHWNHIENRSHLLEWSCLWYSHWIVLWIILRAAWMAQEDREEAFVECPASGPGSFYMLFHLLYFPQEPPEFWVTMPSLQMRKSRPSSLASVAQRVVAELSIWVTRVCALPVVPHSFPKRMLPEASAGPCPWPQGEHGFGPVLRVTPDVTAKGSAPPL